MHIIFTEERYIFGMLIFWSLLITVFALGVWRRAARGTVNGAAIRTPGTTERESALDDLNEAYISGRIETAEYEERRKALDKL